MAVNRVPVLKRCRSLGPVSYTHLDVYKRQVSGRAGERTPGSRPHQRKAPHELHPDSAG